MQKTIRAGSSIPILDSRKSIKSEMAARKVSGSEGSPSLQYNRVPAAVAMSSKGSGDLPNGSGTQSTDLGTNNNESVASTASVLNGISCSESGSLSGGPGRPGTLSDSEDEVFLYEGNDSGHLDSVFFTDGEDTDEFENEDVFDEDEDGKKGNGIADGSAPMDDGLFWKPI